jgi:hypothetical protein
VQDLVRDQHVVVLHVVVLERAPPTPHAGCDGPDLGLEHLFLAGRKSYFLESFPRSPWPFCPQRAKFLQGRPSESQYRAAQGRNKPGEPTIRHDYAPPFRDETGVTKVSHRAPLHRQGRDADAERSRRYRKLAKKRRRAANFEWYTPPDIIALAVETMGGIDCDPASCVEANQVVGAKVFYTLDDDGLKQQWAAFSLTRHIIAASTRRSAPPLYELSSGSRIFAICTRAFCRRSSMNCSSSWNLAAPSRTSSHLDTSIATTLR